MTNKNPCQHCSWLMTVTCINHTEHNCMLFGEALTSARQHCTKWHVLNAINAANSRQKKAVQ